MWKRIAQAPLNVVRFFVACLEFLSHWQKPHTGAFFSNKSRSSLSSSQAVREPFRLIQEYGSWMGILISVPPSPGSLRISIRFGIRFLALVRGR